MTVNKNEIFLADLSPVVGSEQGGTRPVLVIQNEMGNRASSTIIVAAITSRQKKMQMPTHIYVSMEEGKLPKNSIVMLEQIRTIDKDRLIKKIGKINKLTVIAVENALLRSLGIDAYQAYKRLYG